MNELAFMAALKISGFKIKNNKYVCTATKTRGKPRSGWNTPYLKVYIRKATKIQSPVIEVIGSYINKKVFADIANAYTFIIITARELNQ